MACQSGARRALRQVLLRDFLVGNAQKCPIPNVTVHEVRKRRFHAARIGSLSSINHMPRDCFASLAMTRLG